MIIKQLTARVIVLVSILTASLSCSSPDKDASFALGSPKFDKVTISLDGRYYPGEKFEIVTSDNSRINKYAQSYVLDGKELHSPSIPFSSVVSGGKLEIGIGMAPKDNY